MTFAHGDHTHDSPQAQLACETMQRLHKKTGGMPVAVCIVGIDAGGDNAPKAAIIGNATDYAHIVSEILDMISLMPRPKDCLACMANWDALMRARAALTDLVGSC